MAAFTPGHCQEPPIPPDSRRRPPSKPCWLRSGTSSRCGAVTHFRLTRRRAEVRCEGRIRRSLWQKRHTKRAAGHRGQQQAPAPLDAGHRPRSPARVPGEKGHPVLAPYIRAKGASRIMPRGDQVFRTASHQHEADTANAEVRMAPWYTHVEQSGVPSHTARRAHHEAEVDAQAGRGRAGGRRRQEQRQQTVPASRCRRRRCARRARSAAPSIRTRARPSHRDRRSRRTATTGWRSQSCRS